MSVPSKILTCDKCGLRSPMSRSSGNFKYLIGRNEVTVSSALGWCHDCNDFQAIEHFDAERHWDEILECRKEIARLESLLFPWKKRRLIRYQQAQIEASTQMLYVFAKRKGTEKCLECGSTHVVPFDGDCSLKLDLGAYVYIGEKSTGFFHPGCGGEFVATPSKVRLNTRFNPTFYDIEGNRL